MDGMFTQRKNSSLFISSSTLVHNSFELGEFEIIFDNLIGWMLANGILVTLE